MLNWQEFFNFQKMFTTVIIKFLYIMGALIISIITLTTLLNNFFLALAIFVFGHLFWRIFCESLILLFSIHQELIKINQKI